MKKTIILNFFLIFGNISSQPPDFGKNNRDFIYISLFLSLILFIYIFGKKGQRNIEKQIGELANNCEKRQHGIAFTKTDEVVSKNPNISTETTNSILKNW
ncbi:hypothetical protein [Chryseobacterium wanjuense]